MPILYEKHDTGKSTQALGEEAVNLLSSVSAQRDSTKRLAGRFDGAGRTRRNDNTAKSGAYESFA
jgi:hypothetical protein